MWPFKNPSSEMLEISRTLGRAEARIEQLKAERDHWIEVAGQGSAHCATLREDLDAARRQLRNNREHTESQLRAVWLAAITEAERLSGPVALTESQRRTLRSMFECRASGRPETLLPRKHEGDDG